MRMDGRALQTPAGRVTWMLWALTLGSFLTTSSGATRSPFLLDMARDLDTDLMAVANLMAAMSVTWGIASLVAGTASDRFGRKAILTGAIVLVGGAMGGIGLADSYAVAVLWVLAGGIGGGSFMGTVFATVSDHVQPDRRGSALGWVMTGQSVSLVLGVPLATLIGAQAGWRGAHLAFSALTVLVGLAMLFLVPRRGVYQATAREAAAAAPMKTILTPRILGLLGSGAAERVCFAAMTVYLATFLIATYQVPLEGLAAGPPADHAGQPGREHAGRPARGPRALARAVLRPHDGRDRPRRPAALALDARPGGLRSGSGSSTPWRTRSGGRRSWRR